VLAMACTAGLAIGGTLVIGQNLHSSVTTPLVSQTSAPAQSNSAGSAVDWENVAQTVSPAVVTISVSAQNSSGIGSGAIVDSAGNIVTNYHVISSVVDGSGRIQVTLTDGRIYEAKIVGTDKSTDLAVIRLVNPPSDLVAAQFGQSSDLKVGQPVMAIGSPLGLSNTVTTGIVSALNRPVQVQASESQNQDNSKDPFGQLQQQGNQSQSITTNAIQVDASINPGNSGGPLFNEHGQVIGINSSIASLSSSSNSEAGSIGLGFAIPSDLVVSVVNQLIQNGTVDHARLGVTVSTGAARVGNDTRAGAQISGVSQGSGAEAAGLKAGDVITKIDGNTVTSAQSLVGYVRRYMGGQEVSVTYVRDGVENTAKVTLQSEH
jgi:trypsin family serine protease